MRTKACIGALLVTATFLVGFDLARHSVPPEQILSGGPPKDGIPALLDPRFVTAKDAARFLQPDDRILGLSTEDAARAYPLRILTWHEVVNDTLRERPVVVTYCPLTGSAVVFERTIEGRPGTFGVSGLLYQSNVLLYDRETESLWSQLGGAAVAGVRTKTPLRVVPASVTTWGVWRRDHPRTLVLSPDTGFPRDYAVDPYAGYHVSSRVMFPVARSDDRLPAKARVFGLADGDDAVAYPLSILKQAGIVQDRLAGRDVTIDYDLEGGAVRARATSSKEELPGVEVYWFAWAAFHPESRIWGTSLANGVRTTSSPKPSGTAEGVPGIEISSHEAYWTHVPGGPLGPDGESTDLPGLLVIRGELRNAASSPRSWVHLRYELLDAAGNLVKSEDGYSLGGEGLRPVDGGGEIDGMPAPSAVPIAPGKTDGFRMFFLREETPAFDRYRVRILDAPAARTDGHAPPTGGLDSPSRSGARRPARERSDPAPPLAGNARQARPVE